MYKIGHLLSSPSDSKRTRVLPNLGSKKLTATSCNSLLCPSMADKNMPFGIFCLSITTASMWPASSSWPDTLILALMTRKALYSPRSSLWCASWIEMLFGDRMLIVLISCCVYLVGKHFRRQSVSPSPPALFFPTTSSQLPFHPASTHK